MLPLIKPQELLSLKLKKGLVLIDARSGPDAKAQYAAEHLQGALYVDLETDLAQKKANPAEGGRHPLPDPEKFAHLLGQLGIHPGCHVVVYDAMSGANAATRFWWMLRAAGHEQVQVLDGAYQAAVAAGIPTSSRAEMPQQAPAYSFSNWQLPTASMGEVAEATHNPNSLVIDVRDAARFQGKTEPIDLVAGHIPGAVNIPFSTNLDEKGFYQSPEALRAKYAEALGNRKVADVVVHCGSGVTACHTALAMDYAGLGIPKLYVGSWSEWSRNDRPIATGEK